jgi:hypothetical protein
VNLFIDDGKHSTVILKTIKRFLIAFNFDIVNEHDAEISSWFKRFIAKTSNAIKEGEFEDELKKAKRALELHALQKIQSEIDKNQAEAAAGLMNALENVKAAVLHIGSILVVKNTDSEGNSNTLVRTLTPKELIYLENHPEVVKNPHSILDNLSIAKKVRPLEETKI